MSPHRSPADVSQRPVLSRVAGLPALTAKFTPVGRVRSLYRRVQQSPEGFKLETLLAEMRIGLRVNSSDQARIPSSGPVVVVANHPYGVLDGAILTVLLTRVRPDVRILTNFLLDDVPELAQHCIFVDPFNTDRSVELNRRAMRKALGWLQGGGALAIFPAGEISHWQMPPAHIADPVWNDTAVRLIRRSGASALPVYFCGHNGVGFQILGMIHPKLRTGFLLEQFLQQEGKTIEVRVGSEIPNDEITEIEDDRQAVEYLRWRSYLLGRRKKTEMLWPGVWRSKLVSKIQEPLSPAVDLSVPAREIADLPPDRCLTENGELAVYLGSAQLTPHCLRELGRLRELTFRQVGEGTGKSSDVDEFDEYYWHLLLWNKKKSELVGAYRAGSTADILPEHGVRGLYTSTLFRYDERFFHKLGPALELGRSFVRPEYQRQYAPLMLLWKGIARLVGTRPDIPVLFGPVSISNDYCKVSREMIFRFFEARMHDDQLAGLVEPRKPFRPSMLRRWDCHGMSEVLRDLEQLSQPITDVEPDGKGLPILLRQYSKVGGRLLGFNVDRKFSNCLDGLIAVDLRRTDPAVLERYMGKESAARFHQFHSTG